MSEGFAVSAAQNTLVAAAKGTLADGADTPLRIADSARILVAVSEECRTDPLASTATTPAR
jgi:hypothetical protein